MTEQPIRFLRLQGIARDWSKHNEHSRNIFSVHGFLRLSVIFNFLFSTYLQEQTCPVYTTLKGVCLDQFTLACIS